MLSYYWYGVPFCRVRRRARNLNFVHVVSRPSQLGQLLGYPSHHRPLPGRHAFPLQRFL